MNARKTISLVALFGFLITGTAAAAPIGSAKARGDYRSFSQTQRSSGSQARRSSGRTYAYRDPAMPSTPAIVTTQPQAIAQAPAEGRRFSYAPSAPAATGAPCPQAQVPASAPSVDGDRRYSYTPEVESGATTVVEPAPRSYSSRPSYSGGSRSGSSVERWALPKTDPRKYSTR